MLSRMHPALESKPKLTKINTEIVPVFQDKNKKLIPLTGVYASLNQKIRKSTSFTGSAHGRLFLRFGGKKGAENLLLVGFGPVNTVTDELARQIGGHLWHKLHVEKVDHAGFSFELFPEDKKHLAFALLEGVSLASYKFEGHKSKSPTDGKATALKISVSAKNKSDLAKVKDRLKEIEMMTESVFLTRDWSNEPSNYGTPEYYAREAQAYAKKYGLKCKILSEKDAEKEKMGLFLGVGQGSDREGKMVVLEYTPKGVKNPKTIAWVGKGITFDSGGISIKPSLRMEEMKHDKTGAATMMGALLLAARMKSPNRIVAILAFTENMPSGHAIQPGNVIRARSGKTVEVINTDAEGRLILADALDYAHDFKPDVIIDAATLTGAATVALGKHCCAILGNDDALIQHLRKAGESHNERMWELPMFNEYLDDIKSAHADLKNSANNSAGGTIRGGIFLKEFIKPKMKWAHLDIAATSWDMGHLSYCPKHGASGLYVRALAQFAMEYGNE